MNLFSGMLGALSIIIFFFALFIAFYVITYKNDDPAEGEEKEEAVFRGGTRIAIASLLAALALAYAATYLT